MNYIITGTTIPVRSSTLNGIDRNTKKEKIMNEPLSNPAFGMLSFSRVHGGDPNLFGSSVRHNEKILMTLYEGEVVRELHQDWYHTGKTLFEAEMSYTQFAELISSMNIGGGIPVTIRYIRGHEKIEGIKIDNKRSQFVNEFKQNNQESVKLINDIITDLSEIFSEKRQLKAADREYILNRLTALHNAVNANTDFILDQFNESMEHITTEAKGEIEAFLENKLKNIAFAAIQQQNPDTQISLINPVEIPDLKNEENNEISNKGENP